MARMTGEILLAAAARDDSLRYIVHDLEGAAVRAFPRRSVEAALLAGANFVARYENIWYEMGNADSTRQAERYKGRTPLFSEPSHHFYNDVTPTDYWHMFEDYLQKWAYTMRTGSAEGDWYKAQEQLGLRIMWRDAEERQKLDGSQHPTGGVLKFLKSMQPGPKPCPY